MGRFAGRCGLVTGGSEGIGFAIAERLVAEGASVTICGRRSATLAEAVRRLGKAASGRVLDVADSEGLSAWVADLVAECGRLDFLVNNAMHVGWSAIKDTALEEFRRDFEINLDAAFVTTRAAMQVMEGRGGGAIVNIASINGLLAMDNMAAYSASKAALIHFSKCAAMEGAAHNVRVNVVAPGVVATPSTQQALGAVPGYVEAVAGGVPMNRLGESREIAAAVAFLLSDDASYVTGVCLPVDGGKAAQLVVPPPPTA